METFFISGIGTGVGKTFATGFIAKKITSAGRSVSYMKPIQTGIAEDVPDLETVKRICPEIIIDKKFSCPYSFALPASPHFAAKCENRRIRISKIIDSFRKIRQLYPDSISLVEGAGGLMVPIYANFLLLDLIKKLKIPVLLVSSPYIGSINHTLLSTYVLKKEKIPIAELIFSIPSTKLDKTGKNMIETIIRLSRIKHFSIIPTLKVNKTTTCV